MGVAAALRGLLRLQFGVGVLDQLLPALGDLLELSGGARVLANALLETGPPAIGDVVTVAVRPEGPGRVGLWLA